MQRDLVARIFGEWVAWLPALCSTPPLAAALRQLAGSVRAGYGDPLASPVDASSLDACGRPRLPKGHVVPLVVDELALPPVGARLVPLCDLAPT